MTIIIAFFGIIALVAAGTCLKGYVLTKIWARFIVPTFGLPILSLPIAIGIICICNLLFSTHNSGKTEYTDKDEKLKAQISDVFVYGFIQPVVILGIAWIAHRFV